MPVVSEAKYTTLPAPVGGLNLMDSMANMPPTDALSLLNLLPATWGCAVRRGYQSHSPALGFPANSLAVWAGDPGEKLFAFAGTKMYDVTIAGVNTELVTNLLGSLWYGVGYATAGGNYLTLVSETGDAPIVYDGTAAQRLVAGDGTTAYTISGVDPTTFVHVTTHQRRLWFAQKNTSIAWYLPPDTLYGVAKAFDFGPIFKRGGNIRMLATWTVDTGEGSNDHLVALSDQGEAAVYAGLDVDTAESWQLKGLYYIGHPAPGRRCSTKMGGDLMFVTDTGVVSMATVVTSTQVNATGNDTFSKKIQLLLSDLVSNPPSPDNWQLIYTPLNNLLMINIPRILDKGSGQLVSNQVNHSWCAFSGYDAAHWVEFDGFPFYGCVDGRVIRAWTGAQDETPGYTNAPEVPQPIRWRAQQAYNYFETPALQKQIGLYRLNFLVSGGRAAITTAIYYDFAGGQLPYPTNSPVDRIGLWDIAIWDYNAWGGGTQTQKEWQSALGMGVCASIVVSGQSSVETTWVSTDLTWKVGGPL
jgi:hypothetical protein